MNILIVTGMFPPIQTGTSFYSRNIATALVARGHRVKVITVENREQQVDRYPFEVERLRAVHAPVEGFFKHLRFCAAFPTSYTRAAASARELRADVILLVNHYLDIAFPALFAAARSGAPIVCSIGTQIQSSNPLRGVVLRALDRLICGRLVLPFCARIVSWDREIHRYVGETYEARIASRSVIVPFGFNGELATYLAHEHAYENVTQLVGVGAVIPQRDFVFQVKVFKELVTRLPDLRMKVIGHVYDRRAVNLAAELGLADRVSFTGELPHAQVLEELKRSALSWAMGTGEYTGLGTNGMESMLMGVPVVSNVPGDLFGPQLLFDGQNHVHTDGSSVEQTARKLLDLLQDRGRRATIGAGGRRFVLDHLRWDIVSGQLEEVLLEACRQ